MSAPSNFSAPSSRRANPGAETAGSGARERLERIYHKLRERICLLDYPPGMRLSEEALAGEFSVSRTPVRSVLNRLEAEGLVQSRHGVGTFVTAVEFDQLQEVYAVRIELARLIGTLGINPNDRSSIRRLQRLREKCLAVPAARHPRRAFARVNIDCFELLMELVGNRVLRDTLQRLFYQSERIWFIHMPEEEIGRESVQFAGEIAEIAQALEQGQPETLAELHSRQVANGFKRLLEYHGRQRLPLSA